MCIRLVFTTRRPAKREHAYRLPPRFFDDARDSVQVRCEHSTRRFFVQHPRPQTPSAQSHSPPVEVAAVQDKQVWTVLFICLL